MIKIIGESLNLEKLEKADGVLFKCRNGRYSYVPKHLVENVLSAYKNLGKSTMYLGFTRTRIDEAWVISALDGVLVPSELGDELFVDQGHNQTGDKSKQGDNESNI